ncbi:helix-turn-helix domain-containing protein [Plantactinospora veratri]|uniref:Helix-turn-helix domain-containing protein n=1 Tax=Plantactinospora veratri TaxID=1436122 RepID=A0ABU7SID3_9ACTN
MAHQTVGYAATGLMDACSGRVVEPHPSRPVDATLAVLRGRWTALVIREFLHGDRSFSELAQALPKLSDKTLADRLAQLTEAAVLERRRTPGWPPRVRYALTDRGRALAPVLQAMWEWGSAFLDEGER